MPDSSPRYGLALHTSTPELGLAIAPLSGADGNAPNPEPLQGDGDRVAVWDLGYALSSQIHVLLQDFIQPVPWSSIGLLAVAQGPGGFTGTRVGVVTARTLAQQLDVPLFAVSSLAAVALRDGASSKRGTDMAVEMPARRGQIYGGIYRLGSTAAELLAQQPDGVMDQAAWAKTLESWPNPYHQVEASGGLGATAEQVLAIAIDRWQWGDRPQWPEALPFYGQSPV